LTATSTPTARSDVARSAGTSRLDPRDGEGVRHRHARATRDDVGLVVVRAGDEDVGLPDACLLQGIEVGAVALDAEDVSVVHQLFDAVAVDVDDGHVVGGGETLGDGRPDLAGPDDDYVHPWPSARYISGSFSRPGEVYYYLLGATEVGRRRSGER